MLLICLLMSILQQHNALNMIERMIFGLCIVQVRGGKRVQTQRVKPKTHQNFWVRFRTLADSREILGQPI